jgi:ATP-dependent helicase/nuclease subunit B
MSNSILISPADNLVHTVISHLDGEGRDYSGTVVVFPGKRPAHFVRKALGRKLGGSFIPPKIFSIDTFVRFLYEEKLGLHSEDLEPIDAVAILFDVTVASAVHGDGHFTSLEDFLPLGLSVFQEFEEVKLAGMPEDAVLRALSGLSIAGRFPMGDVFRSFYARAGQLGRASRAVQYATVAERIHTLDGSQWNRLILAGFFGLTGAERRIFHHVLSRHNTLGIWQEGKGIAKTLRELDIKPAGDVTAETEPRIHFYKSPDAHGQTFIANAMLSQWREEGAPLDESTVIVLPDSGTLFPVLQQPLALLEEGEFNISLGYPARRTPAFAVLRNLLDLMESEAGGRVNAGDYLRFTLHPYIKNILFKGHADVTRILFHAIEEELLSSPSWQSFRLQDLEGRTELFQSVEGRVMTIETDAGWEELRDHLMSIHNNTIRLMKGIDNLADAARRCLGVLEYVTTAGTASHHPLYGAFVGSLREAFEGLGSSLLAGHSLGSDSRYYDFVRRYINNVQVPFPGTPLRGLQVLGFLETRNLQFERVLFLDLNDDVLPGTTTAESLIPQKIRERLGMPTYKTRDAIASYYVDTLIRGAKEVHLLYVENIQKSRSRFIEQLLWDRQRSEGTIDESRHVRSIRYRSLLTTSAPGPVPKTSSMVSHLRRFRFTATALDTYLRCPLQFYYRHVLKLEERDDSGGDPDRADIGMFVHRVLSLFFSRFIDTPLSESMLTTADMAGLVDRSFPEFFGTELTAQKYLLREQIKRQLVGFISSHQVPVVKKEQVVVKELESRVEVMWEGFHLKGFLDRVEQRGEKTIIADYKTGSGQSLKISAGGLAEGERETWSKDIGSLQLPLYHLMYCERHGAAAGSVIPMYVLLGENQLEDIEMRWPGAGKKEDEIETLRGVIRTLLMEIVDGDVPFVPTGRLEKHCPTCPFTVMCGTQWLAPAGST